MRSHASSTVRGNGNECNARFGALKQTELGQLRRNYPLCKDPVRREAKQGGRQNRDRTDGDVGTGDKRRITTVESGEIGSKCR